uniref:Reverse transcriptase domain-containing protein n=1 Tax=Graphocephala atropunctata TaxID=36148 RepID=A0A1B6MTI7_9HEMI
MKEEEVNRLNVIDFNLSSYFCRKFHSKGGVMILIKNGLKGRKVVLPPQLNNLLGEEKQFEFCLYMLTLSNFKLIIVGLYRSPLSCTEIFIDRLSQLLSYLNKMYPNIAIMCAGDININVLVQSKEQSMLRNMLASQNMEYLINFPTRVTNNSTTAIDNFLIQKSYLEIISVEGIITCLSDHDGQMLKISCQDHISNNNKFTISDQRSFSAENVALFSQLLSKELWFDVYFSPVEEKYKSFNNLLKYYFEIAFPKKTVKRKLSKNSWITNTLKEEKSQLIELSKQARIKKDGETDRKLKENFSNYKKKLNESKRMFYDNKILNSVNISKSVWEIINKEVGNKKSNCNNNLIINKDDQTFLNPKDVGNIFNNYFVSVVELTGRCSSQHACDNGENIFSFENFNKPLFSFNFVTAKEVALVISSLKNKYSSGMDELPVTVLKAVKHQLCQILAHLINSSLISGIFPNELKIAKVIPIHKKDNKKDISNYRQVFILPSTISKVYEKIVHSQLMGFLEKHNLLDDIQHGFRKGRSSVAVEFLESIIESVDKGELSLGVFMDLAKVFDSVEHSIMIEKLKWLGIHKNCLNWFRSYLTNRFQYVEIQHTYPDNRIKKVPSELQPITYGVPQGSILGPLLFLCYLKDMAFCLTNIPQKNLCLYADDANLKISSKTINEIEMISSVELSSISNFLNVHNLKLNVKKTNYLTFKTQQNQNNTNPTIKVDNQLITRKLNTKFLGLIIDENLSWNQHIEQLLLKLNSGIYALTKMSFLCNIDTLRMIYFSYLHSYIAFGLCIYGSTRKSNLDNILKIQKKAIRIMLGLKRDDSVRNYFKELKILTVYGNYILDTIMCTKFKNSIEFQEIITHSYNTRSRGEIIPYHRLSFYTKKPTYMGSKFLKFIPLSIKQETQPHIFKKKLKEYLLDKVLYSLDEFINEQNY